MELSSSLDQLVFLKRFPPDYILVLIEIAIKDLAALVAVDVICVDEFDQHLGFVQRQSSNLAIRCATTVAIERDPHQVYAPTVSTLKSAKTLPPWRHRQKLQGRVPGAQTYVEISTGITYLPRRLLVRQFGVRRAGATRAATRPHAQYHIQPPRPYRFFPPTPGTAAT